MGACVTDIIFKNGRLRRGYEVKKKTVVNYPTVLFITIIFLPGAVGGFMGKLCGSEMSAFIDSKFKTAGPSGSMRAHRLLFF